MYVIERRAQLGREVPARRKADAGRLQSPRVGTHEDAQVLLHDPSGRDHGMVVLSNIEGDPWLVDLEEADYFGEQFTAPLVTFGVRGNDDVVGGLEELSLLFELVVAARVDFEPVVHVERSKSHGHSPFLGFERDVREVAHGRGRFRKTNQ